MQALIAIARQFADPIHQLSPLGGGLINDTFLVSTAAQPFVLQRINRQVFPVPELISTNLAVLAQHIAQKPAQGFELQLPAPISTLSGQPFYLDSQGDFWRALSFIANSYSLQNPRHLHDVRQTGVALAHFHRLCSDLPVQTLHDTLPGFHIAPDYLRHYRHTTAHSPVPVDAFCQQFIERHQAITRDLEQAKQSGELTLRVIHGDPKLDNFLFDQHSGNIIGLVDLDTVKPGLVHYDIGDSLRSCCHSADTGQFDLALCAAWLEGYLGQVGAFFSAADDRYLYPSIRLIPFELGLRFYTDYLDGNRYFKTTYAQQNLHRAQQQFRLCSDIMDKQADIKSLLHHLMPHRF